MKRKKKFSPGEISDLQSRMISATIEGNQRLYDELNLRYVELLNNAGGALFGSRRISAQRRQAVVNLIIKWDSALVAGKWSDAESLIPEEDGSGLGAYANLRSIISLMPRRSATITENTNVGELVSESIEYCHDLDGTIEYNLHFDGRESQVRALFVYENYGNSFGLFVRSIDRS